MSQPPEGPEFYAPPPQPPVPIPPPPSIAEAAAQYGQAQDGNYQYAPPPPAAPRGSEGLAITALVLGIVALVTFWIPIWGDVLGVAAIIVGVIALVKKQSKGMSIGGIVTGGLGALLSAGMWIAVIVVGNSVESDGWYSYSPEPDYTYGGGTTLGPDAVDSQLVVAEQVVGRVSYDDGVWWYVVILDNTGDAIAAADITVQALDASGTVVDSSWTYQNLDSGQTALAGNFWDTEGATVASVAVVAQTYGDFGATTPTVEVSDLTEVPDDLYSAVAGTVTSTSDAQIYGGVVTVVARDASGQIVGGANGYFNELAPGESGSFEAYFYDAVPEGATFEAFATAY